MPPLRVLAAIAALTMCAGCTMAAESTVQPAASPAAAWCPETSPTPDAARPAVLAGTSISWFGQGDLWVGLPDYPPVAEGDGLLLRFPWVTLHDGAPTSALGPPAVVATRTDARRSASVRLGSIAQAFGTRALAFWPASVVFPEPGCWTVRGALGAASVQFVVDVARPS